MKREAVINHLLYVPFNHDYTVDDKIKKVLTEEEFFNHCFFMPDFEKEIEEILSNSSEEIAAFEVDLTREEIVDKYSNCIEERDALYDWLDTNQNDIYCIKGDAGTGKSTFLHYLKNTYLGKEDNKIEWRIIDILLADPFVSVLYFRLVIPEFSNLYYKSIASIISCMVNEIFCLKKDKKVDFEIACKKIEFIKKKYDALFDGYLPSEEVEDFFQNVLNTKKINSKEKCRDYSQNIKTFFENLIRDNHGKEDRLFSICVELYICLLRCENDRIRYILAFDNFERFIGTDEIYSSHLTEFVDKLRKTQNAISNNKAFLSPYYQIIIFMRNTSTRMFTSQQVAELFPHRIDISDWFQVSKIVQKKIDWYNDNSFPVDNGDRILDILNDIGCHNDKFRGLRSKLNMLFNYNKRVILRFLTKVLYNLLNQDYLLVYDNFKNNTMKIAPSFSRFAARMIIYRLILNEIRKDGFFQHIIALKNNEEKNSLGYARKILTILHDFKIDNEDEYMSFNDMVSKLFINGDNYFDINNSGRREKITEVLYYLNYYDGRKDNWLQFIDIQYNVSQNNNIRIEDSKKLENIIERNSETIRIKITSAGIAYLYFVVYSFEFFSCKSVNAKLKIDAFGDDDIPPILCVIPSAEEIKNDNFEDLTCVKILNIVSTEAINCINEMDSDANSIKFRAKQEDTPVYHKIRIRNSHRGFIDNYIHCIRSIYQKEAENDSLLAGKLEKLVDYIETIRNLY